ncbi:MAG TPA: acyltransferase, partial [Anaerolineales bacterium]|nr:acyltransferase [Anaerolineales bacterium]
HHLLIIYTGAGGWPYKEGREDLISAVLGKWITSVNGAYFMGLFLFIAAYFVPGSYDRKGAFQFIKDRLIRLGIPLAVYCWVVRPLLLYAGQAGFGDVHQSFLSWYFQQYFKEYGLVSGPLWFIEALLYFSILYALWRKYAPSKQESAVHHTDFPRNARIALFALAIAIASFLVRLWSPSDKVFWPLSFQLADFPQYIALFVAGLIAYRQDWLVRLPDKTGRIWMVLAHILILIYPPVVILAGAFTDATPFLGGWHWQAMLAATWQSFLSIAMCISVIYIFQRRLDHQNALGRFLSRNAYTVYLIHEPVITFVALLAMGVMIYPLLKFGLAALVAVPLCYGLSSLIRRLPYTQRIL